MKKSTTKLALRTQTLRTLNHAALAGVAGGDLDPVGNGFIMKDTIIIRTSGVIAQVTEGCR